MMGALARVRDAFAAMIGTVAATSVIARIVPTWLSARPLIPSWDIRRLADEGYRKHALIYACINEIATSASEPRIKVGRRQKSGTILNLPDHDLVYLFQRPNPSQGTFAFIEQFITHLYVAGNAYLHKVRANGSRLPVQLWTLRPDRTKVKVDGQGQPEKYEYTIEGFMKQWAEARDVIHSRLPDPLDDYYGLSPIQAMVRWGDLDQQAADYWRAYFLNAGAPSGILKMKQQVRKEERERIKSMWRDQHSGPSGWHNVTVLDSDVEYESLGGAPERLRINYIFELTESRICSAFGVPPIIVGAAIGLAHPSYATYREARASFWDETLSPLYRRVGDQLTADLASEWGPDIVIEFDTTTVKALQDNEEEKRRFALDAWKGDLLTRNESREMMGMLPDPKRGDFYYTEIAPTPGSADPFGIIQKALGDIGATGPIPSPDLAKLIAFAHVGPPRLRYAAQFQELNARLDTLFAELTGRTNGNGRH